VTLGTAPHSIVVQRKTFENTVHMWVAAKRETVIEGINIINSPASKIFQAHVLTRTGETI